MYNACNDALQFYYETFCSQCWRKHVSSLSACKVLSFHLCASMYVHSNMCRGVRAAQQLWTSFTLCCKGIVFTATADMLYLELNLKIKKCLYLELNLKIKKCLYKPLCSSAESPHQRGIYGQRESDGQ